MIDPDNKWYKLGRRIGYALTVTAYIVVLSAMLTTVLWLICTLIALLF